MRKWLKVVWAFTVVAMLVPMGTYPAHAGKMLQAYLLKKGLQTTGKPLKRQLQRKTRDFAAEMLFARPNPRKYKQFDEKIAERIRSKIANRTATRDEYKRLESGLRFQNHRDKGVSRFWAMEKNRIKNGLPGGREWSERQAAQLSSEQERPQPTTTSPWLVITGTTQTLTLN